MLIYIHASIAVKPHAGFLQNMPLFSAWTRIIGTAGAERARYFRVTQQKYRHMNKKQVTKSETANPKRKRQGKHQPR